MFSDSLMPSSIASLMAFLNFLSPPIVIPLIPPSESLNTCVEASSTSSSNKVLGLSLVGTNKLSGSLWNIHSLPASIISSTSLSVKSNSFLLLRTSFSSFIESIGSLFFIVIDLIIFLTTPPPAKGTSSSLIGVLTSSVNIKVPSPRFSSVLTLR